MKTAKEKMQAARLNVVLDDAHPFFGPLVLKLKMVEDPGCGTAWVDGRSLGYDPAFVDKQTNDQLEGLWIHEVMHVASGHPWRRELRDHRKYNIACDKSINSQLRADRITLPDNVYYAEGEEIGKSSEWIYARMPDAPKDKDGEGQGQGEGDGQGDAKGQGQGKPGQGDGKPKPVTDPLGEVRDAPTEPDAEGEPAPTEQDWKQAVKMAASMAKQQGKLPAGMEVFVQEALRPKPDIKAILLRFFTERAKGDYSWAKRNMRYAGKFYLPAIESHDLGNVAIMVDTSGSMCDEVSLAYAQGIVQEVLDECHPAGIDLVFADARVQHVQRIEKGEPLTWEPKGGGGTNFRPALKYIEESEEDYVAILCITDLMGTFPEDAPTLPVIWLSTTDLEAPFGETIHLDQ